MSSVINMNTGATANGGVGIGVMTASGNPWTISDGLADELVNRGLAVRVGTAASATEQHLAARTGAGRSRPNMAVIGTSIASQAAPGYIVALETEYFSHIEHLLGFMGQQFQLANTGARVTYPSGAVVSNGVYGFSGADSDSIAADSATFLAQTGPVDLLILQPGDNDCTSAKSEAVLRAAYGTLIDNGLRAGAKHIVWVQSLPNGGITTTAQRDKFWSLRNWIKSKALTTPRLRIVPTEDLWCDTSATYPVPLNSGAFANYTDGVIHLRRAAVWLGKRIADVLALEGFGYARRLVLPGPGEPGFVYGGNMVGNGGGLTAYTGAAPPSGLTLSNNLANLTSATAADVAYNGRPSKQLDVVAGAQVGAQNGFQLNTGNLTLGAGVGSIGDWVQFFFEYAWDPAVAVTGIRQCSGQITFTGSSGPAIALFGRHPSSDVFNEDVIPGVTMLRATPIAQIPAATTALRGFAQAVTDPAAAGVTFRAQIHRFCIINWTLAGG